MKIRYDDEGDIIYILIKEGAIEDTVNADNDIYRVWPERGNIWY